MQIKKENYQYNINFPIISMKIIIKLFKIILIYVSMKL